jgi:Zn-dependent protease with chaperone function
MVRESTNNTRAARLGEHAQEEQMMRLSMRAIRPTGVALAFTGLLVAGCALGPVSDGSGSPQPQPSGRSSGPALERVTEQDAARLRGIIGPLAKASDHPPSKLTVGILSDKSINAANAGNGEFYVTRGLLNRANDEQLRAILAHEMAHNDLGHVAKAQRLQTGVAVGSAIIEQVIPNAAIVTPIAGTLITRKYSRNEELEADKHGVVLLRRVGSSKEAMVNTLTWLASSEGGGEGGGWFATHPGTNDRIQALRQMP